MSDPAAQPLKMESAATNQMLNDGDDPSDSEGHKELCGEEEHDEPSVGHADVEPPSKIKQDGEMIEKKNENTPNQEEDEKKRQDLEQLEQEHKLVEAEAEPPRSEAEPPLVVAPQPSPLPVDPQQPVVVVPQLPVESLVVAPHPLPVDPQQPVVVVPQLPVESLVVAPHPLPVDPQPAPVVVVPQLQPLAVKPQPPVVVAPTPATIDTWILLSAVGFVVVSIFCGLIYTSPGTQISDSRSVLHVFREEFKSLKNTFPEQTRDLWLRSEKMLQNHLNKSHPREPATIILTAAQDAKRTLLCLGGGLARTYAVAVNATWLLIDGPSAAKYDSGTAKLHIDQRLSSGFESNTRAAVLSRLEMLPSGSLLILYKYCDHENAAYKNVTLVLTVLLDEPSLEPDTPLPEVEEKVRDFLYQQFITSDGIRSHNEMDRDKLGGVWSRISHLVLPVLPVASVETGSCPFNFNGR